VDRTASEMDYYLPREVWTIILNYLQLPLQLLTNLLIVNTGWRVLVYESVTEFGPSHKKQAGLGKWVTDRLLMRFYALQ
jgi:hypothetical protein